MICYISFISPNLNQLWAIAESLWLPQNQIILYKIILYKNKWIFLQHGDYYNLKLQRLLCYKIQKSLEFIQVCECWYVLTLRHLALKWYYIWDLHIHGCILSDCHNNQINWNGSLLRVGENKIVNIIIGLGSYININTPVSTYLCHDPLQWSGLH